jgi:hypothetical protein
MSKADYIAIGLQQAGNAGLKVVRTAFDHVPPIQNEDITLQREELEAEETVGNRAPVAQDYGGKMFSGGISYFARAVSSPMFASMAFGGPTTATPSGAVTARDHTYDPTATNKKPLAASILLVKADVSPKIVDTLVGAKANEYNLSVEANGYLGGSVGVSAVRLLTAQTEPGGLVRDPSPKWSFLSVAANISVNGAALAPIKLTQFGFSYTNNIIEDLFVLGDAEVDDLPAGNIGMEANWTPTKLLSDHYLRALKTTNPDNVRVQLLAVGSTAIGTGGDATLFQELEIDLKRCQYTEAPINANAGETLRSVAVTARPVLDETLNKLLLIRFRNGNVGTTYQAAP